MKSLLALGLAVVLPLIAQAAPKPVRYAALDDAGRSAILAKLPGISPVTRRLEKATEPFLGTPYVLSPLGEGTGVDADPRLRYDAVDCLTFVETSMALAAAPTPDAVLPVLDDIRYAALPAAFQNRNHFVEAQWVPNNLLKGWIRDVAKEIAGPETQVAEKVYGPERWKKRKQLSEFPLDTEDVPRGSFRLNVVPFAFAQAHPERFPSGTLLFIVRKDFVSQPTRVTHVGFVLDLPTGRVFRHASKEPYHRVVDEPFDHFLGRNAAYAKWPVEGFAAFEVRIPEKRVRDLVSAVNAPNQH